MRTRKQKRNQEKDTPYFFEFIKIQKHFFKEFTHQLKKVKDHRHQSYITYTPDVLLFTLLMKHMTGLTSMRRMSEGLNKEECIENIGKVLQVEHFEELPHYDTINDFLSGLEVRELEKIRTYMIQALLKKRCLVERLH